MCIFIKGICHGRDGEFIRRALEMSVFTKVGLLTLKSDKANCKFLVLENLKGING